MTRPAAPLPAVEEPLVVRPSSAAPAGGDNVVDLLRQLANQGSHLAEQQLSLIKAEIREATTDIKAAAGGMAGAAVVGIAGLGVTLVALGYLLGDALDNLGLGTLIVGLASLALAYLLYSSAAKKLSATHLKPDRSIHTLEQTPGIARGALHTERRK